MTTNLETPLSRRTALRGMGAAAVGLPLAAADATATSRRVEGKVVLVTGSSRNLGAATVLELARRGADVIVNGRSSREEAEEVVREAESFGVRAIAILADVGDEAQVNRMIGEAIERMGRIDVLINNAGYRGTSSVHEMSTDEWRAAMAVNLDAPFFCTRAVVPSMIANGGGRIITVSGTNSFHGRTNWSHVCASKMGGIGFTRALAVELAPYDILVNHVVPGAYTAAPDLERIPLGRLGLPQELANMYAFLASDDSSYITGQTFHVNGGELRV